MAGLDDLLGSLTKQGAGSGGGGLGDLLGGLLGADGGTGAASGAAQGGLGGLGDILGGILGGGGSGGAMSTSAGTGAMNMGAVVAALGPLIAKLIKGGGLSKMMHNAQASGLSAQADSWVGTGDNASVGEHEVRQVVGDDTVQELAQNAGISHDQAAAVLAHVVPQVVNGLSPDGQLPADDDLDQLVAKFGG